MTIQGRPLDGLGSPAPRAGTGPLKLPGVSQAPSAAGAAGAPAAPQEGFVEIALPDKPVSIGKVNVAAGLAEDLAQLVPGAKVLGAWKPAQIQQLQAALAAIPAAMRGALVGTTFALAEAAAVPPPGRMAQAQAEARTVLVHPDALALPSVQGTSGLHLALAHEAGRLTAAASPGFAAFARLSGWTQSRTNVAGEALEPAGPVTAALAGASGPARVPGRSGPLGPRPGSGPLGGPAPRPGTGPLGAPRLGSGRLGQPTGPAFSALAQATVAQGSRLTLADGSTVVYTHRAAANFAPGAGSRLDPMSDFAEAFKAFIHQPTTLLAAAPEKFLLLNAEYRRFPSAEVAAMAKQAGVSLNEAMTDLVANGLADQPTIDKIARVHGLSGDRAGLAAKDQALLAQSANLKGLVERLSLDLAVAGNATSKLVQQGARLAEAYHKLAGQLPVSREAGGLEGKGGQFGWRMGKGSAAKQGQLQQALGATRAEFLKLPLAVQLKVDPRLALGAGWFALSADERQALTSPAALQGLIGQAAEMTDQVAYIPQNLNASERKALATGTLVQALFDPSAEGARFRALLGGLPLEGAPRRPALPDPETALKFLRARNGQRVWDLLDAGQRNELKREAAGFKALLTDPELVDALVTIRQGATGAEQIQTAVLRMSQRAAKEGADLVAVARAALGQAKESREKLFTSLGASPLELALTEVNRQVQEGNVAYVQSFLHPPAGGLRDVVGPWVWEALAPAERQLLEQADYRLHLVEEGQQFRATGASLAEEARTYRLQSANLQQTFDLLFQPDQQFRRELSQDPVGALKRRGLWVDMPSPLQQALQVARAVPKVATAVQAVQEAMAPILQRQANYRAKLANLQKAAKQINVGHARSLIQVLDLPAPEMQHAIGRSVRQAMDTGEWLPRGTGPAPFI